MTSEATSYQPVNHVFVDFENVKKVDISVLGRKNFIVHLFLGPLNKKLDVEVVERLLEHSQAVKMIRSPKAGKDALDFVLAYHLGQAVQTDPKAYFHVVSGDEGFDSLVELLKTRNVKVKRHSSWQGLEVPSTSAPAAAIAAAPVNRPANASKAVSGPAKAPASGGQLKKVASLSPKAEEVWNKLKNVKPPPKTKPKLVKKAKELLGKNTSDADAETVVEELRKKGFLKIDDKEAVTLSSE